MLDFTNARARAAYQVQLAVLHIIVVLVLLVTQHPALSGFTNEKWLYNKLYGNRPEDGT